MPTLSTCLWFATEAETAARFYAAAIPGDRMGQVVPDGLMELLEGTDDAGRARFMTALRSMVKLDLDALRAAVAAA